VPPSDPAHAAEICARALEDVAPDAGDLEALLGIESAEAAAPLFAAARRARARTFGDSVFLYGFVYFSTYCRNRCTFCLYRQGNAAGPRYRKTADEVVAICRDLAGSGVDLLDLTLGEDPRLHDAGDFTPLVDMVAGVRGETGLPVMVSPGVVPDAVLGELRIAGADFYACYQETHDRELYARLRVGQDYDARAAARAVARRAGLLVEDGILTGIGDTAAQRARSIDAMRRADCDQARVMTFVPQPGTPLAGRRPAPVLNELLAIAALRLALPHSLIPASLDVEGLDGLSARLEAGANVVTSIVPPETGLAGVSNAELDVEEGRRTVEAVREVLAGAGLRQAGTGELAAWIDDRRRRRPERMA